jgi:uncharacterized protein (DUF1778 family)
MAASAHNIPLRGQRVERIDFRATKQESVLIRQAADLRGWTVTQYVLCAVLDRAERDLCEHATRSGPRAPMLDSAAAEPLHALANIFTA